MIGDIGNKRNDTDPYGDIIHLPHHISPTRPRMSLIERAAQFSPFAALTGHGAAIEETARLTEAYIELDEYEKTRLDESLRHIQNRLAEKPKVKIKYFVPDIRKEGGAYKTIQGNIKKIDQCQKCIVLQDGAKIYMDRVLEMDCIE